MFNSFEEFLKQEEEVFSQFEEFMPRIEKIKEANEIGRKILDFIDDSVEKIDMESFNDIDIDKIVNKLEIDVNQELDGDVLSEIYEEIEETFKEGGRVSLEDYLTQGNILMEDMMHTLKGTVDYSINYSEKQLKEEEAKSFERFNMVMAMQTFVEISDCMDLSMAGKSFLRKSQQYLEILDAVPYCGTIEEKIAGLNNTILLLKTAEHLGCSIKDEADMNVYITNKLSDTLYEMSKYNEDMSIRGMFSELKDTVSKYSKDNLMIEQVMEKINDIDSKIFGNEKEYIDLET